MSMFSKWDIEAIAILSGLVMVVAGFVVLVANAQSVYEAAYTEFMTQCQQDHKEYVCVAMWRAGDKSSDMVIIPIITSSGR